jgi:hypothetical protein
VREWKLYVGAAAVGHPVAIGFDPNIPPIQRSGRLPLLPTCPSGIEPPLSDHDHQVNVADLIGCPRRKRAEKE